MIELTGGALTLEALEAVARRGDEVRLAPAAVRVLDAARAFVEGLAAGADPIYGITTGVGKLKDVVIPPGERAELQRNLVLSHAGGMGAPLADTEVRAIMLLLAASLARGASGVRPAVVETLIACLNRRVHPLVPELGSVGASGDLAPLAHVALCLIGEGTASDEGRPVPAVQALARAGIRPLTLETKEGLALLNGTHLMAGVGALAVLDAERLVRLADVTGAMSLEALMGSNAAFDARIHALRPHPGQLASAANLRRLTAESSI
ncbi:MAG TPA: aromatic amino acid lyase, partial [Gaiellaceae bacterium]|nr:aromatic amino acid lyase [Gaiellaceae bacterium]